VAPCQKCINGQVLDHRCGTKNWLTHFAHPSPNFNFLVGGKCESWPRFWPPSRLRCGFETEQHNWNNLTLGASINILCPLQVWFNLVHPARITRPDKINPPQLKIGCSINNSAAGCQILLKFLVVVCNMGPRKRRNF